MPIEQAAALRTARLTALQVELAQLWPTRPRALTLEIGCGHGHLLTAYAAAHPDETCLGVDLLRDRIVRANRKARRAGLANLAFIHAEAGVLLEALPMGVRLETIFVLFPDPWPKRRHHKNRLIQPDFLTTLARRAGAGAQLHFRTDFAPYFEAALETVTQHPEWKIVSAAWPFEFVTVFQSRAVSYHSFTAILQSPQP